MPAAEGTFSLYGVQSQHAPYLASSDGFLAHSLAQIWAILPSPGGFSTIEFGWAIKPALNGDNLPRLFSGHFDNGKWKLFNEDGGFVQYPGAPLINSAITPAAPSNGWTYGVHLWQNNWWFYYAGQWLGYLPASAWPEWFPSYVTRLEAGGEVASSGPSRPTSWMGNGYYGTNPIGYSAIWHQLYRGRAIGPPVFVNPNGGAEGYYHASGEFGCAYNWGNVYSQIGQFTYGGDGFADC